MCRGVQCIFNQSDMGLILKRILNKIEFDDYVWVIDCVTHNEVKEGRYSKEAFLSVLDKDIYCSFMRIRRYPTESRVSQIANYDEYQNSACSLLLICVDTCYYEIFAKCEKELSIIYRNCDKIEHKLLDYITDDNDCRTDFIV